MAQSLDDSEVLFFDSLKHLCTSFHITKYEAEKKLKTGDYTYDNTRFKHFVLDYQEEDR